MPTLFTKKQFEELEKRISRTEREIEKAVKKKGEIAGSSAGNGWHSAEFMAAYIEEMELRKRLADLKNLAFGAEIIEPRKQNEKVDIGNEVIVEYEDGSQKKFIVEGYIVEPAENLASIYSPLGKALKGAKKGQIKTAEIRGEKPALANLPAGKAGASAFGSTKSVYGQMKSAGRQKIKILAILPPSKTKM